MAWIEFQADKEQLINILHAIYSEIGGVLYETYSLPNHGLRKFESASDLESTFEIGIDKHGNGVAQQLSLWAPSVMSEPNIRTIQLKAGGTREVVEGCGLFSILLGGEFSGAITTSKIGYFTEAGAKKKCTVTPGPGAVNWSNHKQVAGALRGIVKRCSPPANKALHPPKS